MLMIIAEFKNTKKHYWIGDNLVKALDGIDLSIEKGDIVGIIGPSGSGKSTFLHLLGGLDTPTEGSIFVKGKNLANLKDKELAKFRNSYVGFVFQNFNLQSRLTAVENVELPLTFSGISKKERRAKALSALEKVDLLERADHKPGQLSGGQQQRVAIARAIVNEPQLILADEPTGNLDTKSGKKIVDLLKNLNKNYKITLIVVTHDDRIAKETDHIIRITDGKIVENIKNGNNKEFIKKHTD